MKPFQLLLALCAVASAALAAPALAGRQEEAHLLNPFKAGRWVDGGRRSLAGRQAEDDLLNPFKSGTDSAVKRAVVAKDESQYTDPFRYTVEKQLKKDESDTFFEPKDRKVQIKKPDTSAVKLKGAKVKDAH